MDDSDKIGQADNNNIPDWHPADVQAALKKRGFSLAGLSAANGYHPTAAGKALKHRWPALEKLIAAAIGIPPQEIWPSRYRGQATVPDPADKPIKEF
jgi:Ner family transcriptional regulator